MHLSPDWDGSAYQRRFDELAAGGADVHGEATLVRALGPRTVLDAGCGTGRVAIELARHGIEVVGVDADPSMLQVAAERGPGIEWVEADLRGFDLDRQFDVVVMAGNVPLFTERGTEDALVAGVARHVRSGGALLAGFSLGRGYELAAYDAAASSAGLALEQRWATWDGEPFAAGGEYAVSLHRRPAPGPG